MADNDEFLAASWARVMADGLTLAADVPLCLADLNERLMRLERENQSLRALVESRDRK